MKNEKRLLKDIERSYEITVSDINRYKRQAGTITIDVVKRLIGWNYFGNTNPVNLWTYTSNNENEFIVAMDMFDLQLWILENYDIDPDRLDDIVDKLNDLTTFCIYK